MKEFIFWLIGKVIFERKIYAIRLSYLVKEARRSRTAWIFETALFVKGNSLRISSRRSLISTFCIVSSRFLSKIVFNGFRCLTNCWDRARNLGWVLIIFVFIFKFPVYFDFVNFFDDSTLNCDPFNKALYHLERYWVPKYQWPNQVVSIRRSITSWLRLRLPLILINGFDSRASDKIANG